MNKADATDALVHARFPFFTPAMQQRLQELQKEVGGPASQLKLIRALWTTCPDFLHDFFYPEGRHDPNADVSVITATTDDGSELSKNEEKKLQRYIQDAYSYKRELKGLDHNTFHKLYREHWQHRQASLKQEAASIDRDSFFHFPESDADYAYWWSVPVWEPEEAAALLLGKEPKKVNRLSLAEFPGSNTSIFKLDFERMLERILRAVSATQLTLPVSPAKYVKWAEASFIPLTSSLVESIPHDAAHRADEPSVWKERYDKVAAELATLKQRIHNDNDNDFFKASGEPKKSTYLRVLLGMAITRFEYRTGGYTNATSQIEQELADLQQMNDEADSDNSLGFKVGVSDDTIRKMLLAAEQQLEARWVKPIKWAGVKRKPSK